MFYAGWWVKAWAHTSVAGSSISSVSPSPVREDDGDDEDVDDEEDDDDTPIVFLDGGCVAWAQISFGMYPSSPFRLLLLVVSE